MEELDILPLAEWNPVDRPLYIFGPCSAESHHQVMETAKQLKATGMKFMYRAGIWKPRTRPGSFEGHGIEALKWMQDVKSELDIPIITEVANAEHVEACLEHGVDNLWIGARTTVNPFSVQEIADALKGVDIPVMVKNPIHPDLSLWIGALERVNRAGIKKLTAIHRGFHYHENYPYRNQPNWELAIELKRRFMELPIICDASHISGNPKIIPRVAQRAMDLYMDGLLIESHIDPPNALSDAKQQVTPASLAEIVDRLELRAPEVKDPKFSDELHRLRERIDNIDESLTELLAERMSIVGQIGEQKRARGVTIFQLERWTKIRENFEHWGRKLGLREDFIHKVVNSIHSESIEIQQKVMNEDPKTQSKE